MEKRQQASAKGTPSPRLPQKTRLRLLSYVDFLSPLDATLTKNWVVVVAAYLRSPR
jgi:hypothetical protein